MTSSRLISSTTDSTTQTIDGVTHERSSRREVREEMRCAVHPLDLVTALKNALLFAGSNRRDKTCYAVHLRAVDGRLQIRATDRHVLSSQTINMISDASTSAGGLEAEPGSFHLLRSDARTLISAVPATARRPVHLAVTERHERNNWRIVDGSGSHPTTAETLTRTLTAKITDSEGPVTLQFTQATGTSGLDFGSALAEQPATPVTELAFRQEHLSKLGRVRVFDSSVVKMQPAAHKPAKALIGADFVAVVVPARPVTAAAAQQKAA